MRQSEVAVVTTFGKPVRDLTEPGPYLKWPWPIQKVYKFDQRVQNFEDKFSENLTADNNNLLTSVYVGWKISDAATFFPKFAGGSVPAAQRMLESMLRSAKSAVIGKHTAVRVCERRSRRSCNSTRSKREIKAAVQAQLQTNNCGMQLEFLGFKKIGLPESVTQAVFARMTSERQMLISQSKYEGEAEAQKIKSAADRQASETVNNAVADATRIRGEGEAEAAKVLPVFQQNPELANFLLRIDALQQSLNQRSTLIFDERTPPFDLFTGHAGEFAGEMNLMPMSDESQSSRSRAAFRARTRAPAADDAGSQALAEALGSSFAIVKIVMVLMVLAFFCSGFFTVGPQEKAVILRFGKPVGEGQKALLTAGLHWSLPYPIDEVVRIPISEIQKVSSNIGWYFTTPEAELSGEEMPAGASLNPAVDGYVFTADRNIIHTRATLYYHIEDPLSYVFDFTNAVQHRAERAGQRAAFHRREVQCGRHSHPRRGRISGGRAAARQRTGGAGSSSASPLTVARCRAFRRASCRTFLPRSPPRAKTATSCSTTRTATRTRLLNQSGAQATSITNAAAAERARYVESITAEAKRFGDLLPQYQSNSNLFVQMNFVQAMEQVVHECAGQNLSAAARRWQTART